MPAAGGLRKRWGRAARLAGLGLAGTLAVAAWVLVPTLGFLVPKPLQKRPIEWLVGATALGYGLAGLSTAWRVRAWRAGVVSGADAMLGGRLTAAAAGLAGLLFLGWFPQYLTWPWSRDTDTFAVIAQGWDGGVRPYREVLAYNFPGHTYLHWLVGKAAGWGSVAVFNAVDASTLPILAAAMVAWSRRRLGGALPGLVGLLAFLWHYLGYPFDIVAQRDYHASMAAALALLAAQGLRGRWGLVASGSLLAAGLTIRPQVVLFGPAIAWAVAERAGMDGKHRGRAVVGWGLAAGLATVVGFAPLWANGLLGDFLRSIRTASPGGPYSRSTPEVVVRAFVRPFRDGAFDLALAGIGATALLGPRPVRRAARPWVLAVAGALVYGPISPVQHDYLCHARNLFISIGLALPAAWIVATGRLSSPFRVLAALLLIYEVMPEVPRFVRPLDSLAAPAFLARGGHPPWTPSGAGQAFHGTDEREQSIVWTDHVRLLNYLADSNPTIPVANLLNRYPYESLNGPAGRTTPIRSESGICWMFWVAIDLDPVFAAALEADDRCVVAWEPDQSRADPKIRLPLTFEVVRRLFEPAERFGTVEIWRRKPTGPRPPDRPHPPRDGQRR